MVKKIIELIYKVKKDFSGTINKDEKTFEKEMDATKVHKKIAPTLLLQNFIAFGEMIVYAAPAILLVYDLIKSGFTPEEDSTDSETESENQIIADEITQTSDDFGTEINMYDFGSEGDSANSYMEDLKDDANSDITTVNTDITNAILGIQGTQKLAVDAILAGSSKLEVTTTVNGNHKEYTDGVGDMLDVDMSKPTADFIKSVTSAMNTVVDTMDSVIAPAYSDYTAAMVVVIDNLNTIFSYTKAPERDTYSEENIIPEYMYPSSNYNDNTYVVPNQGQGTQYKTGEEIKLAYMVVKTNTTV